MNADLVVESGLRNAAGSLLAQVSVGPFLNKRARKRSTGHCPTRNSKVEVNYRKVLYLLREDLFYGQRPLHTLFQVSHYAAHDRVCSRLAGSGKCLGHGLTRFRFDFPKDLVLVVVIERHRD